MDISQATENNCQEAIKAFGELNPDNLFYIRELCAMNGVPLDQVNVKDLFLSRDGRLLEKKAAINERFFKFVETIKPKLKPIEKDWMKSLAESFKQSVMDIEGSAKTVARDNYLQAHDNYFNFFSTLTQRAENYKRAAFHFRKICGEEPAKVTDLNVQTLCEELSSPFWTKQKMPEDTNEQNHFITPEIVLTLKVSSKEHIKANLGRFIMKVNHVHRNLFFKAERQYLDSEVSHDVDTNGVYIENLTAWHPFLRSSGSFHRLCVGNEADVYSKFLVEGNLGAMIALSRNVLTHFDNETAPYIKPFDEIKRIRNYANTQREAWADVRRTRKPEKFNLGYQKSLWRYKDVIKTSDSALNL